MTLIDGSQGAVRDLQDLTERLRRSVATVVEGKDAAVTAAITVMLAGGHLLVEDVPGVGKTVLAKALARASGCTVRAPVSTSQRSELPVSPTMKIVAMSLWSLSVRLSKTATSVWCMMSLLE